MILRQAPAMFFLGLIAFTIACMHLLAAFPSSPMLWWVNQEVYCRFIEAHYLIEGTSLPAAQTAAIFAAVVYGLHRFGRREAVAFVVNHTAFILLLAVLFSGRNFTEAASASEIVGRSGWVLAILHDRLALSWLGVVALSCLLCHWRFLAGRAGRQACTPYVHGK